MGSFSLAKGRGSRKLLGKKFTDSVSKLELHLFRGGDAIPGQAFLRQRLVRVTAALVHWQTWSQECVHMCEAVAVKV